MWPVALSGRLPVVALVSHYLTNKLIGREVIFNRKTFQNHRCLRFSSPVLALVSQGYPEPKGRYPRVTHPCATNVLLRSFDLHVLSLPPAFVLSQDQTLKFETAHQLSFDNRQLIALRTF